MTETVAVLGAGRMGGAMVGTLRRAGFGVVAWNRDRDKADEVAQRTGALARGDRDRGRRGGRRGHQQPRRRRGRAERVRGDLRPRAGGRRRARDEHDRAGDGPSGRGPWVTESGAAFLRCAGLRERVHRREWRAHDHGRRRCGRARARAPGPGGAVLEDHPRRRARDRRRDEALGERPRPRSERRPLRVARARRARRRRAVDRVRGLRVRGRRRALRALQARRVRATRETRRSHSRSISSRRTSS